MSLWQPVPATLTIQADDFGLWSFRVLMFDGRTVWHHMFVYGIKISKILSPVLGLALAVSIQRLDY
jgi:hypothetical protein